MPHSLLVPLDGTRLSEAALPLAEGVARTTGATVHLAHVHVPHPPLALLSNTQFHFEGLDLDEYDEEGRRAEREYLASMADRVSRESAASVVTVLLDGEVAATLERYRADVAADTIVLATRCRTGVHRSWAGSVAERLIRGAGVAVLAVHAEESGTAASPLRIHNLLVPLDGSQASQTILPIATELSADCDARITLLLVLSNRHPAPGGMVPALPDQWPEALERGEVYLESVAVGLRSNGLRVDTVVMGHASPSAAILEVAEEARADVIAMATHGYTGLRRVLFGSVTETVLRESGLPVLIRRPF